MFLNIINKIISLEEKESAKHIFFIRVIFRFNLRLEISKHSSPLIHKSHSLL